MHSSITTIMVMGALGVIWACELVREQNGAFPYVLDGELRLISRSVPAIKSVSYGTFTELPRIDSEPQPHVSRGDTKTSHCLRHIPL